MNWHADVLLAVEPVQSSPLLLPPVMARPARPDDAAACSRLARQLGYEADDDQIRSWLIRFAGEPSHAVYVAEAAGAGVVGWIHVFMLYSPLHQRFAEIAALIVDDSHRRRGVGRALVAHAEQWARRHDCDHMLVRSNEVRSDAHAFYVAGGYDLLKTQSVFRRSLC